MVGIEMQMYKSWEQIFMFIDQRVEALMAAFRKTTYFRWMAAQAIPVVDGFGVEDVRDIAMAPWARTGGNAAFINLYGMEGVTGMYVGEIPAGGALKAEKHFGASGFNMGPEGHWGHRHNGKRRFEWVCGVDVHASLFCFRRDSLKAILRRELAA